MKEFITYELAQDIGLIDKPVPIGRVNGQLVFDKPSLEIRKKFERDRGLVLCEVSENGYPFKAIPKTNPELLNQ